MSKGFSRWDPAEFMRSAEDVRIFLEGAASDGTPDEVRSAIGTALRYLGAAELSKQTGMSSKRILAELNSLDQDTKTLQLLLRRMGIAASPVEETPANAAE